MEKGFIIRLVICICLYVGCWGLVYPELLITSDTCNVVCEDGTEEEMQKQTRRMNAEQLYQALQEATPGQVRYRSRLLELLEKICK